VITFDHTAAGIPCKVVVTDYKPGTPDGRFEPGDPEEIEWHLADRRGRKAEWLEARLTCAQFQEIEQQALDKAREEYENDFSEDMLDRYSDDD
jgi:hypothetical protein